MRWLALGSLLVLACARCGGGDGDGDGAGGSSATRVIQRDGPIPVEHFARALAEAACDSAERCELGPWMTIIVQEGHCVDSVERSIALEVMNLKAAALADAIAYDGAAARACVDSFAEACPPCLLGGVISTNASALPWCPEAFPGCETMLPKQLWKPPGQRGATCDLPSRVCCATGLACQGSGECLPVLPEGSACTNGACEPGTSCTRVDDASTESVCAPYSTEMVETLVGIYAVDRELGASCALPRDFRPLCNPDLLCEIGIDTCIAPIAIGEPCDASRSCAGNCDPTTDRCVARTCER